MRSSRRFERFSKEHELNTSCGRGSPLDSQAAANINQREFSLFAGQRFFV
jgi:hypothetical protein